MNIGLSESNRLKIVAELSKILADEYVLFTKTKNAHWNINGIDFYEKHKLFDEQATQLGSMIDLVAERIRTLGAFAPATLRAFLELTQFKENKLTNEKSLGYITELLACHEAIILHLRTNVNLFANEYGDAGTSDIITGLLQSHEKIVWILSTLKQ